MKYSLPSDHEEFDSDSLIVIDGDGHDYTSQKDRWLKCSNNSSENAKFSDSYRDGDFEREIS